MTAPGSAELTGQTGHHCCLHFNDTLELSMMFAKVSLAKGNSLNGIESLGRHRASPWKGIEKSEKHLKSNIEGTLEGTGTCY